MTRVSIALATGFMTMATPVLAQSTSRIPAPSPAPAPAPQRQSSILGSLGGLGGLLGGGGLPNVGSAGMGNVAGLLGYCVKNRLLGGAGTSSVLGRLTGQQGVTNSPGYAAGQSGMLQTGENGTLPLDALKDQAKSKICRLVLDHAQSFL